MLVAILRHQRLVATDLASTVPELGTGEAFEANAAPRHVSPFMEGAQAVMASWFITPIKISWYYT